MVRKRKPRGSDFKAKVAIAALRERKTGSELSKEFDVHSTQIHQWKKLLQERASDVFESGGKRGSESDSVAESKELYEQIGRLKMELEWLKKNFPLRWTWFVALWIARTVDALREAARSLSVLRHQ